MSQNSKTSKSVHPWQTKRVYEQNPKTPESVYLRQTFSEFTSENSKIPFLCVSVAILYSGFTSPIICASVATPTSEFTSDIPSKNLDIQC